MPLIDWLQLGIFIVALVLVTKYLGAYLVRVLDPTGKTFLDRLLKPLEKLTYRLFGIDPQKEQNWKQFTVSMLLFSFVSLFFTYIILRIQQWLPLNPQGLPNLSSASRFQYRRELYDEHELAKLCRGSDDVIFLPDGCARDP